ncbi:MAG: sugar transferase [Candidatus Saccharicenans sp.]|nr:sugar transferase [Candidatus Saccharicenans sp.]MDI6849894.1 sugar transferase [Candidatus Saccharicenans sp.]
MLKERDRFLKEAAFLFDIVFLTIAFIVSYGLREKIGLNLTLSRLIPEAEVTGTPLSTFHQYALAYFLGIVIWMASLVLSRSYKFIRIEPYYRTTARIVNSSVLMFFGYGTSLFVIKAAYLSRLFFFIFIIIGTLALLVDRAIVTLALRKIHEQGYNWRHVLVVGTGKRASEFINKVRKNPDWGIKVIGIINDDETRDIKEVNGVQVIGFLKDLLDIFHRVPVDQVIFILPRSRLNQIQEALEVCEVEGKETSIAIDLYDMKIARSVITEIDGIPLLSYNTVRISEWQLFIKRAIDIVISSMAIFLLSPIYVAAAVAIKLTSPGSVFFRQERLGLHGRKFKLLKFRTMRIDADKVLSRVDNLAEMTTPRFKNKKLGYITPVGRILRKFSIDELPQFINVLAGDMSIVGPRPTVPCEVEKYEVWQRRRFSMKPGITCLWQISGRNEIDHDGWMKLDLEYIDNFSLWLDISIIFKTVPAVLFGKGAY